MAQLGVDDGSARDTRPRWVAVVAIALIALLLGWGAYAIVNTTPPRRFPQEQTARARSIIANADTDARDCGADLSWHVNTASGQVIVRAMMWGGGFTHASVQAEIQAAGLPAEIIDWPQYDTPNNVLC